jgi:glycosidase
MTFKNFARAPFYKTLLNLRKNNIALASDAAFSKVDAGEKKAVYAYTRQKGGKKVLVILNLSPKGQTIKLTDKSLYGNPYNVFAGKKIGVSGASWTMPAWGYAIYEY